MPLISYLFVLTLLLTSCRGTIILTSSCCTLATGSCRSTCEEISLVELATNSDDRWRYIAKLKTFCTDQLIPFWSCMNETLSEIDKGQSFFGRPCCTIPQSQACIMVCLQAKDREELMSACRPSNEITFYSCLEKQEVGQYCCGKAERSECASACRELFSSTTEPSVQLRTFVANTCANDNINKCVQNYTLVTPAENPTRNLHCCDKSSNAECRLSCRNILRTQTIGQEIVDNLIDGGCGEPLPHDKLWQCFLTNADSDKPEPKPVSNIDNVGMDSAKLHCCFRATTITCQRLCIKTFSNEWDQNWIEFEQQCQYQLAESSMLRCLAEVEEPCELGCDGLTYCTNFNHRPTELFRNCNSRTDQAARMDVEIWERGLIRMPTVDIPVLDIAHCHGDMWKAIACALQIKPCQTKAHSHMICRTDCMNILSNCVDRSRLLEGQTPESLCDVLSPPEINSPCISLAPFLERSKYVQTAADVTHPCKANNSCGKNEVCIVNRNHHLGEPFTCVPGCRMGVVSHLIVPSDTYVQIPRLSKGKHCHSICQCNRQGVLDNCIPIACLNKGGCSFLGKHIKHQGLFESSCTVCFCFAGELRCIQICPKNHLNSLELVSDAFCSCSSDYLPVCGQNGKTYANPCIAGCAGLKENQFKLGVCSEIDPCLNNTCNKKRCIPKRQVCLTLRKKCPQYICVGKGNCEEKPYAPVCDTHNEEHRNVCHLAEKRRIIAYFGKCRRTRCERKGKVCGHNGQEYYSECAALVDGMVVDYKGACAVPHNGKMTVCSKVTCSPLASNHCTGVVPPNSCCPVCGAVLKLVYSQRLLDQTVDAIHSAEHAVISNVVRKLQEQVKTAECEVSAYLDDDSSVVAILSPNLPDPSPLQVEVCIQEARKLHSLIEQGSPTLVTQFPLSSLIGSYILHPLPALDIRNSVGAVMVNSITTCTILLSIYITNAGSIT